MNPRPAVDPLRLISAADSVLLALGEVAQRRGEPWPYSMDLAASVTPLCEFSREEIEQGTFFLFRAGILEPVGGGA